VEHSLKDAGPAPASNGALPIAQPRSKVDIILPCHNADAHLQQALHSVFAQTYANWRIYAVDDGSRDNTLQILKSVSSRCSFVSQRQAGAATARNRSIRMSNNPFIAFLDADDEWLPSKLETQIARLESDPTLGLICSRCSISESGVQRYAGSAPRRMPNSGKLFAHLVRDCFIYTPTVVVRRSCLAEIGLFNESLAVSEDFNLWLRIAACWNICFLPDVLAITHKRPGSLSSSIAAETRLYNGVLSLQDVQRRSHTLTPAEARALRDALAQRFYFYGAQFLSTGASARSRPQFRAALKLRPRHWRAFAKLILSFLPTQISNSLAKWKRKFQSSVPTGAIPRRGPACWTTSPHDP
jgi:glycosyltransferase involved in cell wall biosynthesis